jgi:BirA family biotin operon repressor/biotin-[acetyl-CoA-carboxylase] ligase
VSGAAPELVRLAVTASTMDSLHDLAAAGAPAGTAVMADEQTEGRGSRRRAWRSSPGGLWLSVLGRPTTAELGLVSLRAGLAVADALGRLQPSLALRLKWPNDLMLGDRKVGGLLCEARWQGEALGWVVVGLGLNVTNAPPPELAASATSLSRAAPGLTRDDVAGPVAEALRGVDAAAGPLTALERRRFAERDWLLGRELAAPVAGRAAGLASDGALLVRQADGTVTSVRAGTVLLAEVPAANSLSFGRA